MASRNVPLGFCQWTRKVQVYCFKKFEIDIFWVEMEMDQANSSNFPTGFAFWYLENLMFKKKTLPGYRQSRLRRSGARIGMGGHARNVAEQIVVDVGDVVSMFLASAQSAKELLWPKYTT